MCTFEHAKLSSAESGHCFIQLSVVYTDWRRLPKKRTFPEKGLNQGLLHVLSPKAMAPLLSFYKTNFQSFLIAKLGSLTFHFSIWNLE